MTHLPVLAAAVTEYLVWDPSGLYVDGTVGAGSHGRQIRDRLSPSGRLLCFDWDIEMLAQARLALAGEGPRVDFFHSSFSQIGVELRKEGMKAHGIFLDLGLNSQVLDDPQRGFQHRDPEAPLDMRMDRRRDLTAASLLDTADEAELMRIFRDLGETRRPGAAARAIVRERAVRPLRTAGDLAGLLRRSRAVPGGTAELSRIFQALRFRVNDELAELDRFLDGVPDWLIPGGRLVVISYESLSDRRVKQRHQLGHHGRRACFRLLTRRVVRPGRDEVRANPRARSAKLRALERTIDPCQA